MVRPNEVGRQLAGVESAVAEHLAVGGAPPARAYGHLRWAELSRRGSRRPPRAAHARARARPSASDVLRHPASSARLSPHSEVTPELNPAQRASLALPPAR